MTSKRLSEDVRPISELKERASEILDHVQQTRRPVLVTRRGQGIEMLLDLSQDEALTDRSEFVAAVQTGARAAHSGDLHPNEEALKILDTFGE